MCGIVGYIGRRRAQPVLLEALSALEYRGYDSCGLAVANGGGISVTKDSVRVADLANAAPHLDGGLGIGHTRWASVGAITAENAHPHLDCGEAITVVHNGNITNYLELKRRLEASGHRFRSDTDSEVIAHLIEEQYRGDLMIATHAATAELDGSYAIIAMHRGEPRLVADRCGGPLVIGLGEGENWLASDVTAILSFTSRVIYLQDGDLAVVEAGSVAVYRGGQRLAPDIETVDWLPEQTGKSGYHNYMLKEIHEQPRVIRDLVGAVGRTSLAARLLEGSTSGVIMPACGSSYHAGLLGAIFIEDLLGIPVKVGLASEFGPPSGAALSGKLAIGLSQSGETADTLGALQRLRRAAAKVLALTNVPGSSITRLADETLFTHAGPEIGVAATKTFTAQLVALIVLVLSTGKADPQRRTGLWSELRALPAAVRRVVDAETEIATAGRWLAGYRDVICIGRGSHYPIALEAALKLKEVAYLHAEGCAAGELKHGTLALVSDSMPVIAFLGTDNRPAMLTAIREVKARGAPVLAIAPAGDTELEQTADRVIFLPRTDPLLQPVLSAVALQLLAYYTALELGLPIDTPRHLAKSVTVE